MVLGWYRGGSKLAFIVHRNFTSNVPIRRTNLFHTFSSSPILTHDSKSYPRCSGIKHEGRLSPFVNGMAGRYYSVDWNWVLDYPKTAIIAFIGSVVLINIFKRFEIVPFTNRNRSRFIYGSHRLDKLFGHIAFELQKELLFTGKILPATNPESVRVRLIATNIINSLHRGKEDEEKEVWIDVAYASDIPKPVKKTTLRWFDMFVILLTSFDDDFSSSGRSMINSHWGLSAIVNYKISSAGSRDPMILHMDPPLLGAKDNEDNKAVDVKWVQNCRKKARYWKKPTTNHMKTFNWEILLLKDCTDFTSFSLPGGKILISTQFLDSVSTDDEIAVILGHEIAHALARHSAEKMTKYFWVNKIDKIRSLFGLEAHDRTEYFLSFTRNVEVEADYIGLLLMACAGYDPRVAPGVYKKLNEIHGIGGDSKLEEFECRFDASSWEMRSRLLAEPKVMEEALLMYHEATAVRGD